MRVKEPSTLGGSEKTKRSRRTSRLPDEDSSDDIIGLTCHHVSQSVDVTRVKKAVSQNVWSACTECMKERRTKDGGFAPPVDVWLCLKCGHQGCSATSECQHSLKHFQSPHNEPHCIAVNLSTWIICCYECDEELSTHCNKKALAQMLDFLQKHSSRCGKGSSSKVICFQEQSGEIIRVKTAPHTISVPVKGITNLGNTCFFNAVMQNLSHTHMLTEALSAMKEKAPKLRICLNEENLDQLVISLPSPGPLTSAVVLFLHSMKEPAREPVTPKMLFSQLCQNTDLPATNETGLTAESLKGVSNDWVDPFEREDCTVYAIALVGIKWAPRFKTFQQQDSQELLHYLLDALRSEETKRIQSGILKAFNNPTTKTADEDTKRKVKAYGGEGIKANFIDQIFVGELTSTIMCEECETISSVKEAFIDLSLPIIEGRVSKPAICGRGSKVKITQDNISCCCNDNSPPRMCKPGPGMSSNNQLNEEQKVPEISTSDHSKNLEEGNKQAELNRRDIFVQESKSPSRSVTADSQSDGSERDGESQLESSGDADSEASDCENSSLSAESKRESNSDRTHVAAESSPSTNNNIDLGALTSALSTLNLNQVGCYQNISSTSHQPCSYAQCVLSQNPLNAFQTLSLGYVTSSKECSVQSCLYQFTSVELLMGNNKLLCEKCTENRMKYQKKDHSTEKRDVYTNARKQLLISAVPASLILHLKRFCQNGLTLRKINRHVDFSFILDLAPFCSVTCKNVLEAEEKRVLYSLYGVVEHSGSMKGGHYVAYVKIRIPFKQAFENISDGKNSSVLKDGAVSSSSQWVYISDTHVQVVSESRVLNSQAYLLFYERLC